MPINDHLRDLFPHIIDRAKDAAQLGRRALPWVYWPAAAVSGLLMVVAIPPVGVLALTTPALLYWRTRKLGLDRVGPLVYYAPFLPLLVITFFAGLYYLGSSPQRVTPLIVVGAVAFIVSTYGFATMLNHADSAHLDTAGQRDEADEAFAAFRLLWVKVVVATCILFATQSWVLLVCLVALFVRTRLTAMVAGLAAGTAVAVPLVASIQSGEWSANLLPTILLALAAVKAAQLWFKAAFNPFWPNR
ncbi:hypothetical protein [Allokutzneria sp. NRRL B-24872]|uniref:hypothetical protein n=1 Tax=Allokutzneria sp. NRRL B-24872 TaxID=1137961 RepID=UPI000A3B3BBE|nr:hypothetical protein [Allokutzneria sp. NRRL B-24872]